MRPDSRLRRSDRKHASRQLWAFIAITWAAAFACPGVVTASGPVPQEAPPVENVSVKDREAWRKILRWSSDCEEGFESPDGQWGGVRFHRLAASTYFVEVTCSRGAYQGSHTYFLWNGREGRSLEFVTYEAQGDTLASMVKQRTTELWGDAEFNARKRTLTVSNRFRGPGDCGSRAIYRITSDGATLVEFRAKPNCDGRMTNPNRWRRLNR